MPRGTASTTTTTVVETSNEPELDMSDPGETDSFEPETEEA